MGNLKPAPVLHEVQHGRETWRVYRTSRRGYEVVVHHPASHGREVMVWVSGHRWLWRAKRRANRGAE